MYVAYKNTDNDWNHISLLDLSKFKQRILTYQFSIHKNICYKCTRLAKLLILKMFFATNKIVPIALYDELKAQKEDMPITMSKGVTKEAGRKRSCLQLDSAT